MATMDEQGRVMLPRVVRDALGLRPGSEVEFEIKQDGVRLRRRISRTNLEKWAGCLPASGDLADVDALMDDLRGA